MKRWILPITRTLAILIFLVEIIGSFALVQIDASENILGKIGYVAIIYGVLSTIALYQVKKVLLVKTYIERKQQFLQSLRAEYSNQQVDYSIAEQLDFTAYEAALPNFSNQTQYNSKIEERGSFRKKCKQVAEKIALELSQQLNITVKEVYRYSYKFAVENIPENELNVRALLAQTMKRVR